MLHLFQVLLIFQFNIEFNTLFLLFGLSNCGICPSPSTISPCTCTTEEIVCSGDSIEFDLAEVFETLSYDYSPGEQQFQKFTLKNTSIEQLPNDVFQGVWFRHILFQDNINLTCVHPYAFGGSQIFTKKFESFNTSFAKM